MLSASRWQIAMRALRHRNFQLFFSGQLISLIGTWMQTVAQSWLVYRLTGSSLKLGLVGFASQIPVFIMAPVGGTAADRFNRHRVIIATQAISMVLALILAGLTLSHEVQVPHILIRHKRIGTVEIIFRCNSFSSAGKRFYESTAAVARTFYQSQLLVEITYDKMCKSPRPIPSEVSSEIVFIEF